MGSRREIPLCPVACHYCRAKKARCSGTRPCSNCEVHHQNCSYPTSEQRVKQRNTTSRRLEARLKRMEACLQRPPYAALPYPGIEEQLSSTGVMSQIGGPVVPHGALPDQVPTPPLSAATVRNTDISIFSHSSEQGGDLSEQQNSTNNITLDTTSQTSCVTRRTNSDQQQHARRTQSSGYISNPMRRLSTSIAQVAQRDIGSSSNTSQATQPAPKLTQHSSEIHQEDGNIEYHGNTSFLSICFNSGIEWISRQIESPDFSTSARKFSSMIYRGLKLDKRFSTEQVPEPSNNTARRWVAAFFEDSVEHSTGLVQRPSFEARFESHLTSYPPSTNDVVWYALRNVVYAIGCRIDISGDGSPTAYTAARDQSWHYFENAMSVHSELLYMRTDTPAVEALLLMAYFAEAIASPAIEYMILSAAVRLAQSKGFHLQTPNGINISEEEKLNRAWLWWCIYAFDKHIASRSGRPSAIDDSEISVFVPTVPRPGTKASIDFFTGAVRHAQISSQVCRGLSTTRLSSMPISKILDTIRELDRQLNDWHASLNPIFKQRPSTKSLKSHPTINLAQCTYLYFSYYGTLCSIHNIITYPWVQPALLQSQHWEAMKQARESSKIISEASRAIAMATQSVDINAGSPVWLVFYYPVLSLINLFIHVLQSQGDPCAATDISLMEVLVGHFSRLEYATNLELSIHFAKELVALVRKAPMLPREQNLVHHGEANALPDSTSYGTLLGDQLDMEQFSDADLVDFGDGEWPFLFPAFGDTTFG